MNGLFFHKKQDAELVKSHFSCLTPGDVQVQLPPMDKYAAIRLAGNLLVERGSVLLPYIDAMIERENTVSTYLGEGVAVPHGIGAAKQYIKATGLVVLQFAGEGVAFEGGNAKLLVAFAGQNEEHVPILQAVAKIIMNEDLLTRLKETNDPLFIHRVLTTGTDGE